MASLEDLFRFRPSPQYLALFTGLLGAFGVAQYGYFLATGRISRFDGGLMVLTSLLLLAAGLTLWRATPRGWLISWGAMIAVALAGWMVDFAALLEQFGTALGEVDDLPNGFVGFPTDPTFLGGFLMLSSGFFFAALAHRGVYEPCFASTELPYPIFGATPALLCLTGLVLVAVSGGVGWFVAPFFLVFTLVATRWMYFPLLALLQGREDWGAG